MNWYGMAITRAMKSGTKNTKCSAVCLVQIVTLLLRFIGVRKKIPMGRFYPLNGKVLPINREALTH